jgi:hypothetical protein
MSLIILPRSVILNQLIPFAKKIVPVQVIFLKYQPIIIMNIIRPIHKTIISPLLLVLIWLENG